MQHKVRAIGWRLVACLLAILPFFTQTACAPATVDKPLAESLGGDDPANQMEFWHQLAEQPVTSYDDAFHAVLIFADGADASTDYAARVAKLKEKGLLAKSFDRPGNHAVDRGTLSVALARAMKMRGGLTMSLFGPSARYATKELEYAGIYPASSPNQTFSGSEFLSVISRAEEYQETTAAGKAPGGAGYTPPALELRQGAGRPPQPAAPPDASPPATQPTTPATGEVL